MLRTVVASISALAGLLLVAPTIIVGMPFWIIASAARVIHDILTCLKNKITPWQQLIEFAPEIGWKPKANMSTYAYADKPFYVTTDEDGWRGKARLADSDVVVFGDSYAFGYGVSDNAFFADLNPNLAVKCIGVNGYDMVQELLWMRRLASNLSGKLVIWLVYHGNDLYENLQPNLDKYAMPFVRKTVGSEAWEIVTDHVSEEAWRGDRDRDYYSALAQICTPTTSLSRRAFLACEYLLREGNAVCEKAGARLWLFSVPDITQICQIRMRRLMAVAPDPVFFDPALPDARLQAMCERLRIRCVALKDYLKVEHHKEHDAHWNEKGHRRVAALIEELYRAEPLRVDGQAPVRLVS